MRKTLRIIALVFAASLVPTVLRADNITYDVNVNIGGDILTGTITTDGTIGPLSAGNISSYSLSDSENILGTTFTPATSTIFTFGQTSALYASPTEITVLPGVQDFYVYNPTALVVVDANLSDFIFNSSPYGFTGFSNITSGTQFAIVAAVPALNPSSGTSALALLVGAVLVIRGRRKKSKMSCPGAMSVHV